MRIGEQRQADRRVPDVDGLPEGAAADLLDERDHDVAAVERQHGQEIQDAEGEADEPEHLTGSCCSPARQAWAETRTIPTELEMSFVSLPVAS